MNIVNLGRGDEIGTERLRDGEKLRIGDWMIDWMRRRFDI